MKSNLKLYSFVVYITCLFIVIAIIRQIYLDISVFPFFAEEMSLYEPFPISDWLINYQGGFVRRGLAGEVLWQLYQLHPYPVILAIISVCSTCLIIMTALCVWLFNRIGVSKWMLFFPMFLYFPYYGLYGGILGGRRDILILLLGLILFWLYRQYTLTSAKSLFGGGKNVGIWFLSVVILLLHEGMFFFFFPFLITHTFLFYRPSVKSIFSRLLVLWWPVAIVMVAVVLCHGNDRVPEVIWQSWMPCFKAYPVSENVPSVGMGPACLSYSLSQNIGLAIYYSFHSGFVGSLPSWPFTIYLLMGIYYLFTRMDMLLPKDNRPKLDHVQMSNIIVLQIMFVLPLLGLISCDWYRTIPCCCITSCFLYYFFPERRGMPVMLDRFSSWIQNIIDNNSKFYNQWTYYIILVTLPLCYLGARIGGLFPFVPNDLKPLLLEILVK